jgi:hypothetical protein
VVQEHEKDEHTTEGFDALPEAREVLNQHLTLSFDSSLAVRSIYGQRFPWFVFLDQRWATQNISSIFPAEETFRDWWNAAWETYAIYCLPRANVFHLLSQEYQRAVERIGSSSHMEQHPYNPEEHLAEHLMTLYWRGTLDLYEPEGILAQFFTLAPDMLRSYALEFIGRSLCAIQEAVPLEVLTRLQKLWEWYIEFVSRTRLQDEPIPELATFGWWFSSGKFDDIWATIQLEKILKEQEKIDIQDVVVKHLAQLSVMMPLPAVTCLYLLVLGNKDIWITDGWKQHVRIVIANALNSSDREASRTAKQLINLFESRGISDFRSIIRHTGK